MTTTERVLLLRRLVLEYATLAWNVVGTVFLAVAAVAAGSLYAPIIVIHPLRESRLGLAG